MEGMKAPWGTALSFEWAMGFFGCAKRICGDIRDDIMPGESTNGRIRQAPRSVTQGYGPHSPERPSRRGNFRANHLIGRSLADHISLAIC